MRGREQFLSTPAKLTILCSFSQERSSSGAFHLRCSLDYTARTSSLPLFHPGLEDIPAVCDKTLAAAVFVVPHARLGGWVGTAVADASFAPAGLVPFTGVSMSGGCSGRRRSSGGANREQARNDGRRGRILLQVAKTFGGAHGVLLFCLLVLLW